MAKGIFVVGSGTDVGKTYVTALLVKKLASEGKRAGYYKAAMSGNVRDVSGALIPGDAKFVKDMAGIDQTLAEMCPYIYENAYSPHLASRIEGELVKMSVVKDGFTKVTESCEFVTVEGSGGILCPIRMDGEEIMLEDLIGELGLSTILVADAGLGTINAVVLTVHYMRDKGIPVKGIIYNNYEPGNVMHEDNISMCEKMTQVETLAKVKKNDTEIAMELSCLEQLYEEV